MVATTFDAIVVGAGAIGLAIGWRAQELGLDTIVLDRGGPEGSASHLAAGMLAPVSEASFTEERLLGLNLESARRYPSFLEELSLASGRRVASTASGTLFVALDRDQAEALRRLFDFQTSLNLSVEWLSGNEARELEPSLHPSARAAVLAKHDLEVDPRQMIPALESAFSRAGGNLRRDAEVVALNPSNGSVKGVRLTGGEEIAGAQIVLAAGCWSGEIEGVPEVVARNLRPVKGQILRLRPRRGEPVLTGHVIRTEEVYLVPRPDGGVVVGATMEEQGFDTTLTAGGVFELLRAAEEAMPGIREFELYETGAGLRPGTPDNAPLLGRTGVDGLLVAAGHFRNGILLTPLTADSIASLLAKDEVPDEIAAFSPERFSR